MTGFQQFSIWYMVISTSLLIISFGWNVWQHVSNQRLTYPPKAPDQLTSQSTARANTPMSNARRRAEEQPGVSIPSDIAQIFYELMQSATGILETRSLSTLDELPGKFERFIALYEVARLSVHHKTRLSELDSIARQLVLLGILRQVHWPEIHTHADRYVSRWRAEVDNASVVIPRQLDAIYRAELQSVH